MKFPISRLMKEELACYYNENFDKLVIQYDIGYKNLAAHINLIGYAMDKSGRPMHKEPLRLRVKDHAINRLVSPFILGNLQLKRGLLEEFMKDDKAEFLDFEAFRNTKDLFYYIGFKISSNKIISLLVVNPCPWDCPKE